MFLLIGVSGKLAVFSVRVAHVAEPAGPFMIQLCAGRGNLHAKAGKVFAQWNEGVGRNLRGVGLDEIGRFSKVDCRLAGNAESSYGPPAETSAMPTNHSEHNSSNAVSAP
jgi:hypothetical protein